MTKTPPSASGAMPAAGLKGLAVEKWQTLYPRLVATGRTDPEHLDLLAVYCDAYASWREATMRIGSTGHLIKTKTGIAITPWLAIRDHASATMADTGKTLGFDPTAHLAGSVGSFTTFVDMATDDLEDDGWADEADGDVTAAAGSPDTGVTHGS